jgi:Zn finger protein HypA/HybF involved in hydrogenase expression
MEDNLQPAFCPKCKKVITESLPGTSVLCPKCHSWVKIPSKLEKALPTKNDTREQLKLY